MLRYWNSPTLLLKLYCRTFENFEQSPFKRKFMDSHSQTLEVNWDWGWRHSRSKYHDARSWITSCRSKSSRGLSSKISLIVDSHMHLAEIIAFEPCSERPTQLIFGNGGTPLIAPFAPPSQIDGVNVSDLKLLYEMCFPSCVSVLKILRHGGVLDSMT